MNPVAIQAEMRAVRAAARANLSKKRPPPVMPQPSGMLAKELEWEKSVPRCESCRYCRKEAVKVTRNSRAIVIPPVCLLGNFYTRSSAVCRRWMDSNGSTLE